MDAAVQEAFASGITCEDYSGRKLLSIDFDLNRPIRRGRTTACSHFWLL